MSLSAPLHRLSLWLAAAALATVAALAPAAPARAQDSDDLVRFLLGAAAVAVIVRAIDSNSRPEFISPYVLPDACLETVRLDGRQVDVYNGRCLSRAGYSGLPDRCAVDFRTNRGSRVGYEARCLYRAGYQSDHGYGVIDREPPRGRGRLPRSCEMTYRLSGDRITGYDSLCLRGAGFTNLPRRCERTTQGGDILYDGQCLWDAGLRRGR